MAVTRIKNNQITDSTIVASAKILAGSIVGSLFAADLTLNSNVAIIGNLDVQGNLTTISSTNTYVNDPILTLNNGYLGAPTYDVGLLVNRNLNPYNVALMWRESDQAFEVFYTTETGGTYGTINQTGFANLKVGYSIADTVWGGNVQLSGDVVTVKEANGNLQLAGNGTGVILSQTSLLPGTSGLDLGSATQVWNTVYTGPAGVNLNGSTITESSGNIVLTPNGGSTQVANLVITGSGSVFSGNIVSGNVTITGGTINNTVIGGTTPAVGTFSVLNSSNVQLTGGAMSGVTITSSPISGSSGSFTTLAASSNVTFNGSNAQISLQPTGSGTVSIAPATTGSINNMSVGATTPSTGAFTTLSATSFSASSINNTPIGNATPSTGVFTTLTSTGLTTAASLAVNAAATVGGNLTVSGSNTTVNALTATSSTVTGNASVGNNFSVTNVATLGTMITSNAQVTGGAINGTVIGATNAAAATFTTLAAGLASFAALNGTPIGNATPSTGAFTTLSTSGNASVSGNLSVTGDSTVANVTASGNVDITSTVDSTSSTTGALTVAGGVGVALHLNVGANVGVAGTTFLDSGSLTSTTTLQLSSATGNVQIGNLSYPQVDGGLGSLLVSDGAGHLSLQTVSAAGVTGNAIILGSPTDGSWGDNNFNANTAPAILFTNNTFVTDAIDSLTELVGLLVPPAPPNFPNATTLSINSLAPAGTLRMTNFVQTNNTTTGSKSVAAGTAISNYLRTSAYSTNTIQNVGPGNAGNVVVMKDSVASGTHLMVKGTGNNGTFTNLIISNNVDYSTITGKALGFWYSFNAAAAGTVAAGWNEVYITDDASGAVATNTPTWYYDSSAPGTPVISTTTFAPSSNVVAYSSSVPHYTSAAGWTWSGTVTRLSGDLYPNTDTFFTGSAGGSFQAPASLTYSAAGITTPLARNLYVSSGSASISTTANIANVTGSSSVGPTLSAINSYATGTLTPPPGGTLLTINTSATSPLNENSIVVTSVGSGAGNAVRVGGFSATDTPSTASPSAWTSSAAIATSDATIVAGVLKNDVTNYSSGYFPVGPNLSSHAGTQYVTFQFSRTAVSKFDISFTGKHHGCWVALPGSSMDTTAAPTNGWVDATVAYAGSGVPGSGVGGNGSNGAALSGTMTTGSVVTQSITVTFGTESSTNSTGNDIYVRFKLNTGDSITALSFVTATH